MSFDMYNKRNLSYYYLSSLFCYNRAVRLGRVPQGQLAFWEQPLLGNQADYFYVLWRSVTSGRGHNELLGLVAFETVPARFWKGHLDITKCNAK